MMIEPSSLLLFFSFLFFHCAYFFFFYDGPLTSSYRTFSFSALPAVQFRTVSDEDNVLVRTATAEGKNWFYAVNLSTEQRTTAIPLGVPEARNAATGDALPIVKGSVTLTLRSYELVAIQAPL